MRTFMITVNEKTAKGKKLVDFLKTLDYIKVNESPYNPEFVKEIQKSRISKGKAIETKDLWK
ncbi:DUF2683 family protein [Gaoshiqia sediminis]|uniref:Uncharacterized protein n=1 Tax=Gaoshiqia sediminis TaxID=2986998 RepID=A0AA41YDS9_9BACT|nr:DUF2683 family protein [Gaoshiqia sediminis]MCW0485033.1 hypothetical protein [Gaoshiqia sediminis]